MRLKRFFFPAILFLLPGLLFSQTYSGSTGPITDDGQLNVFPLTVSGLTPTAIDTNHGLVSVCIDITHTYDSDLDVYLESPDGTSVMLFSGIGGGDDNFTGTCLSDTASTPIAIAGAPFTGTFRAMDVLGNVNNGQNGNGTWRLRITDTYAWADVGTLLSWSITFGADATGPFVMDSSNLPLVIINTYGQTIADEPKITAQMKIIHNGNGQYNHLTDSANVYDGYIGIEIRGSYSAYLPQKPYGIETRNLWGIDTNVSLLGMPAENDWILLALYNDKVFMRNTLAFKLFDESGHYGPRHRFCEVMIDGSYKGMYVLTEKIKKDNDRVDIATLDADDNFGDSLTGGYIIKLDYHDANNSWLSNFNPLDHPTYEVYYVYAYPEPEDITYMQKIYIQSFMNTLETSLYGSNFTDSLTGYRNYLGVNSFIDYFIVNEVARNNDGFKKSVYWHKDRDSKGGKLKSGPVWDFDWAWKNVNECSIFSATNGSGWAYMVNDCNPDNRSNAWTIRLLEDSSFSYQLHCRWMELRQTLLDTAYLFHYIDSVHQLVEEAQARHYLKWPILGINTGTPEVGPQPTTYDGEVQKFKDWIVTRLNWLDDNMPGECPDFGVGEVDPEYAVRVFPNPASELLFVETDLPMAVQELYDVSGKLVLSSSARDVVFFDVSALQCGLYFLRIRFENGAVRTQKVAVSR